MNTLCATLARKQPAAQVLSFVDQMIPVQIQGHRDLVSFPLVLDCIGPSIGLLRQECLMLFQDPLLERRAFIRWYVGQMQ